jgi:hypothetical protein
MADSKISALPGGSAITGAEEVVAVQGGANVKLTTDELATFAKGVIAKADEVTVTERDAIFDAGGANGYDNFNLLYPLSVGALTIQNKGIYLNGVYSSEISAASNLIQLTTPTPATNTVDTEVFAWFSLQPSTTIKLEGLSTYDFTLIEAFDSGFLYSATLPADDELSNFYVDSNSSYTMKIYDVDPRQTVLSLQGSEKARLELGINELAPKASPEFTGPLDVNEQADPTASASGRTKLYPKTGGGYAYIDDAGEVHDLTENESGTWPLSLPNGGTLTVNSATYTKVGRGVHIKLFASLIAPPNDSGFFVLGGLPFVSSSTADSQGAGVIAYNGDGDLSTWGCLVDVNSTQISFQQLAGGGTITNAQFLAAMSGSVDSIIIYAYYEV